MNTVANTETETSQGALDGHGVGYGARHARLSWRFAVRLAVVLALIILPIGLWIAYVLTGQDEDEARRIAVERADGVLSSRSARVSDWLGSRTETLDALARGDALRIVATELAAARDSGRDTTVSSELVFLRIALERQVRALGADGAMLAYLDGTPWLQATEDAPLTLDLDQAAVEAAARNPAPMVRVADSTDVPVLTLLAPVPAFDDVARPVGVLGARFHAVDLMSEAGILPGLAIAGETVALMRVPTGDDGSPMPADTAADTMLTVTRDLESLPGWRLEYQRPLDLILSGVQSGFVARAGIVVMATITVIGIVLGLSWRQGGMTQRSLAAQSQRFAERMAHERHLLNTIINGITEYLFVVDDHARIQYANAAACALTGFTLEENVGRPLADALDSAATAQALLTGAPDGERSHPMSCDLVGEPRWVMCLRNQLGSPGEIERDGESDGTQWVLMVQDVTDLIGERMRAEALQQSIVRVLGRTVGAADPYLADQSERIEELALAMADALGIDGDERLTIEMAAKVSQIGKLFVPRDLLNKPDRLTPEERAVLRSHPGYAAALIEDLGTDLPIAETVMEITERLDGSGYPDGLMGDEISEAGRLLAVADVMAARTADRAHRKAASPADVLEVLRHHPDRFDATMVAVAGEVLGLTET